MLQLTQPSIDEQVYQNQSFKQPQLYQTYQKLWLQQLQAQSTNNILINFYTNMDEIVANVSMQTKLALLSPNIAQMYVNRLKWLDKVNVQVEKVISTSLNPTQYWSYSAVQSNYTLIIPKSTQNSANFKRTSGFTLALLIDSVRQAVQSLGMSFILRFMIQTKQFYSTWITPSLMCVLITHFYVQHVLYSQNISTAQLAAKYDKKLFEQIYSFQGIYKFWFRIDENIYRVYDCQNIKIPLVPVFEISQLNGSTYQDIILFIDQQAQQSASTFDQLKGVRQTYIMIAKVLDQLEQINDKLQYKPLVKQKQAMALQFNITQQRSRQTQVFFQAYQRQVQKAAQVDNEIQKQSANLATIPLIKNLPTTEQVQLTRDQMIEFNKNIDGAITLLQSQYSVVNQYKFHLLQNQGKYPVQISKSMLYIQQKALLGKLRLKLEIQNHITNIKSIAKMQPNQGYRLLSQIIIIATTYITTQIQAACSEPRQKLEILMAKGQRLNAQAEQSTKIDRSQQIIMEQVRSLKVGVHSVNQTFRFNNQWISSIADKMTLNNSLIANLDANLDSKVNAIYNAMVSRQQQVNRQLVSRVSNLSRAMDQNFTQILKISANIFSNTNQLIASMDINLKKLQTVLSQIKAIRQGIQRVFDVVSQSSQNMQRIVQLLDKFITRIKSVSTQQLVAANQQQVKTINFFKQSLQTKVKVAIQDVNTIIMQQTVVPPEVLSKFKQTLLQQYAKIYRTLSEVSFQDQDIKKKMILKIKESVDAAMDTAVPAQSVQRVMQFRQQLDKLIVQSNNTVKVSSRVKQSNSQIQKFLELHNKRIKAAQSQTQRLQEVVNKFIKSFNDNSYDMGTGQTVASFREKSATTIDSFIAQIAKKFKKSSQDVDKLYSNNVSTAIQNQRANFDDVLDRSKKQLQLAVKNTNQYNNTALSKLKINLPFDLTDPNKLNLALRQAIRQQIYQNNPNNSKKLDDIIQYIVKASRQNDVHVKKDQSIMQNMLTMTARIDEFIKAAQYNKQPKVLASKGGDGGGNGDADQITAALKISKQSVSGLTSIIKQLVILLDFYFHNSAQNQSNLLRNAIKLKQMQPAFIKHYRAQSSQAFDSQVNTFQQLMRNLWKQYQVQDFVRFWNQTSPNFQKNFDYFKKK